MKQHQVQYGSPVAERQNRREEIRRQEERFRREWEEANGSLPGRAEDGPEPEPAPVKSREPRPGSQLGRLLFIARQASGPFSLQRLAVLAWRKFPDVFGLDDYEEDHPSDTKVRGCLYGPCGLITRGLVRRRDDGLFEVVQ